MLCDTEKERLSVPSGKWRIDSDRRPWLYAVVDGDRLLQGELLAVDIEAAQRALGDAGDCVDFTQTLLQNDSVDEHLRESEVCGNVRRVEVMQRDYGWAEEGSPLHRDGIGKMHHICPQLCGKNGKLIVVPEITTDRASSDGNRMQTETRVVKRKSIAERRALPFSGDEVDRCDLRSRKKAASHVRCVAGDT